MKFMLVILITMGAVGEEPKTIEHEGKSISIRFLHIIRQRGTELKQPDLEFDGRKSEASAL